MLTPAHLRRYQFHFKAVYQQNKNYNDHEVMVKLARIFDSRYIFAALVPSMRSVNADRAASHPTIHNQGDEGMDSRHQSFASKWIDNLGGLLLRGGRLHNAPHGSGCGP